MGRLYIPAENQVDGPWLLSHENLEKLNALFNDIDIKLKQALEKTIEATARQQMEEDNQSLDLPKRIAKLQRKYNQKTKYAEVTFSDGTTYKSEDIEGILNYVDTNSSHAPIELYIKTIHGNKENEFDLIINSNAGKEEVDFEYRIKCIDEEAQQKIKSIIDKWIRENKSHTLLQIWSNVIVYFIYFIGAFTIFISGLQLTETETRSRAGNYKSELKSEAKKIIEKGIPQGKSDSVLLLILKLQADYTPDNRVEETIEVPNKGARKIFAASLIIFLIALIRPKTIIGIGKKYNRLKLYKTWIHVTWGVLVLLAGTLLSDSFIHFINW